MVEAPGTAPGSDRFIPTAVYRHSRLALAATNISVSRPLRKGHEQPHHFFKSWARAQRDNNNARGDFIRGLRCDRNFPNAARARTMPIVRTIRPPGAV